MGLACLMTDGLMEGSSRESDLWRLLTHGCLLSLQAKVEGSNKHALTL
jgi:hypothetical protein